MKQADIKEPRILSRGSLLLFKNTGGNLEVVSGYYSDLLQYTGELKEELERTRRELKKTETALKDVHVKAAFTETNLNTI